MIDLDLVSIVKIDDLDGILTECEQLLQESLHFGASHPTVAQNGQVLSLFLVRIRDNVPDKLIQQGN